MGMPEKAHGWTREMVLALPDDGNRYELFDGELLVTPAPAGLHQFALTLLWKLLDPYVTRERVGWVMVSPADLSLGGEQLSQPDLFVMPFVPAGRAWPDFPDPILVVEALSPTTAHFDRFVKRRRFQRHGIAEYWILDLDARALERWRPHDERPEILDEQLSWHPEGASATLELDVAAYFRDVWEKQQP